MINSYKVIRRLTLLVLIHVVLGLAADTTEKVDRISRSSIASRAVRALFGPFLGKHRHPLLPRPFFRPSLPLNRPNPHQFLPSKPPKPYPSQPGWPDDHHEEHFFQEVGNYHDELKDDFSSPPVDSLVWKEQFSVDEPHEDDYRFYEDHGDSVATLDLTINQGDIHEDPHPFDEVRHHSNFNSGPTSFQNHALHQPPSNTYNIHNVLSNALYRGDVPHKEISNENDKSEGDHLDEGGYNGLDPNAVHFIRLITISYLQENGKQ